VGAPPADPPPILGLGPRPGPGPALAPGALLGSAPAPGAAVPALAVLLAEHEPEVAELARRYLTRAGVAVTITTGADATTAALIARTADVAVLDLTMPGLDARRLRRLIIDQQKPQKSQQPQQPQEALQSQGTRPPQETSPSRLPTLFLLSPSMRPRDLRIAAESCLYRPFSPRLLVSRVLAVAPRPAASHPAAPGQPTTVTGSPTSTSSTNSANSTNSPTRIPIPTSPLTPAESALLSALADHPGHVLSRSRLQAIVGRSTPGHPASGRAIDVHVSSLRAKLPDPGLVRTVRGVGYILDEPSPDPDELSPTLDGPGQTGSDAPGGEGG
jgi:DNA-binding response OmpR family regulator